MEKQPKDWNSFSRPTANELRKLIGKHVAYRRRSWEVNETIGIVKRVEGKNVEIDTLGSQDWYWFGSSGFSFHTLRHLSTSP